MRKNAPKVVVATLVVTALALAGCAPGADEEEEGGGDVGETESAVRAQSCGLSRATILSSVSGARRRAIERGFTWLDGYGGGGEVPYSQSRTYQGYRTDCSGFVSMCWELGRSYTTADFVRGGGKNKVLRSYDELLPADALVRRSGTSGHAVLFLGWADKSKTAACVLEQNSTREDMMFRARSAASLKADGYKAIRSDELDGEPAVASGDDDAADEPTTCLSPTLDREVPALACVQSQLGVWYQCKGGRWYKGVSGDEGPHGSCSSKIAYAP